MARGSRSDCDDGRGTIRSSEESGHTSKSYRCMPNSQDSLFRQCCSEHEGFLRFEGSQCCTQTNSRGLHCPWYCCSDIQLYCSHTWHGCHYLVSSTLLY